MIANAAHPLRGIYASVLVPFADNGEIAEERFAAHVRKVTSAPGIVGVLCNGHAGEVYLLTSDERRRVVELAAKAAGQDKIIVSGVLSESSEEAAKEAKSAVEAGADVILVFPPFSWSLSQDDTMAVAHHTRIGQATEAPLMIYQASVRAGAMAYSHSVLERLVQLPHVVGVKEGSWESATYDANRRLIKRVAPHVEVMASGDQHLLSCFVLGSDGSLVSLAALIPDEIVALDRAVENGDMAAAAKLHTQIQPLADIIYGDPPVGHATARLKMCAKLMGQWACAAPRPPGTPLAGLEVERLRAALAQANLLNRKLR